VEPESAFWPKDNLEEGKPVDSNFAYFSHTNTQWLTPEDLKKIIEEI
jgi:threonyl-tRNA synthetase